MAGLRRFLRIRRLIRQNRRQRQFRHRDMHFGDFTDAEIFQRYRFRRQTIIYIVGVLTRYLEWGTRRNHSLSPLVQVLVALRFFATGSLMRLVGDTFGISVATVSRCVHRVARALCLEAHKFIKFPTVDYEVTKTKNDFYRLAGKYTSDNKRDTTLTTVNIGLS